MRVREKQYFPSSQTFESKMATGELCSNLAHGHVLSGMPSLRFQTMF